MSTDNVKDGCECTICHKVLARKADMPRHMKTHAEDRESHSYKCPWPQCDFLGLQKSNVQTHYRTHTKDKSQACPHCEFTTCDPGSLTRHKKRTHGYVPKPRRRRAVSNTSKNNWASSSDAIQRAKARSETPGHHPFKRESTIESTSSFDPSSAPSPSPSHPSDDGASVIFPVFTTTLPLLPTEFDSLVCFPDSLLCSPGASSKDFPIYWDWKRFTNTPWPKPLAPAIHTCLQNQEPVQPYSSAATQLLLAESCTLSARKAYPDVPVYVPFDMNTATPQVNLSISSDYYVSSSNPTSGWEDLGSFNIDGSMPQISAASGSQYKSWSLAQPPYERMRNLDIVSAVGPVVRSEPEVNVVPGAQFQCMYDQDFNLGFDYSLAAAGSPTWSSSCSSPGSSSLISFSAHEDQIFSPEGSFLKSELDY